MTLTPKIWDWGKQSIDSAWLADCPADRPLVWQAALPEAAGVESHLVSLLSPDELARLARFHRREDQLRFLTGRGLLRILVGAHLDVSAAHVRFGSGPFGKPFVTALAGAPPVHFNVAHSGNLVLLAFHPVHEVGVDVEEVHRTDDLAAVAQQVFGPDEYSSWLRLDPMEQPAAFFKQWTRREAGLKAAGIGFSGENKPVEESRLVLFELTLPGGCQGAAGLLPATRL